MVRYVNQAATNAIPAQLYARLATYAPRWNVDSDLLFRKPKAIPAQRKGATKIKKNMPSEANPDHTQNSPVSKIINKPPNVANKTKKEKNGGEGIRASCIVRQSKT